MAETSSTQSERQTWKEILADGLIQILLRLLDRGRIGTLLLFVLMLGLLGLLAIIAWKVPGEELGPILSQIVAVILKSALGYSLLVILILLGFIRFQRRVYKVEIRRIGDEKSELQKIVDPNRIDSGHDIRRD